MGDRSESGIESQASCSRRKVKTINWSMQETKSFIELMVEKRVIEMLDGKRFKHIDIFKTLENKMAELGFEKDAGQMKTKLKHFKKSYYKCKRNNAVSGANRASFAFYNEMDELLGGRPSAQAIGGVGVDSGAEVPIELAEDMELPFELIIEEEDGCIGEVTPAKRAKKGGRLTHTKLAENFTKVFVEKQGDEMKNVLKEQMEMLDKTMNEQMERQHQWEERMQEKEHEHQCWMLESFMRGISGAQISVPVPIRPRSSQYNIILPSPSSTSSPSPTGMSTSSNEISSDGPVYILPTPSPPTNQFSHSIGNRLFKIVPRQSPSKMRQPPLSPLALRTQAASPLNMRNFSTSPLNIRHQSPSPSTSASPTTIFLSESGHTKDDEIKD